METGEFAAVVSELIYPQTPAPPNTLATVLHLICNPGFGHKAFAPAASLPGNLLVLTIHQNNS